MALLALILMTLIAKPGFLGLTIHHALRLFGLFIHSMLRILPERAALNAVAAVAEMAEDGTEVAAAAEPLADEAETEVKATEEAKEELTAVSEEDDEPSMPSTPPKDISIVPLYADPESPAKEAPMHIGARIRFLCKDDFGLPAAVTGSVISTRKNKNGEVDCKISKDGYGDAGDQWVLSTDPRISMLDAKEEKEVRLKANAFGREERVKNHAMHRMAAANDFRSSKEDPDSDGAEADVDIDDVEDLPEGWTAVSDPITGSVYYWHPASNKTQWEIPVENWDASSTASFTTVDESEIGAGARLVTNDLAPHLAMALEALKHKPGASPHASLSTIPEFVRGQTTTNL